MHVTAPSSSWKEWGEGVIPLTAVATLSIAGWRYRGVQPLLSMGLLAIGLMFDILSAFFYTLGLVTRRHVSGLPVLGLLCYVWAWLALPRAVLITVSGGIGNLWLCKLADLVPLVGFHLLFHTPFWTLLHHFLPHFNSDGRTRRQT